MAAGGPVALSEAWIGSRVIAHDLDGDDLADVLQQNGDASAWAIVPREETPELLRLAKILGLDEYAVSELLTPASLPGQRVRRLPAGQDARR
ncbi:hypothetical protein GCM10027613_13890 [Microlunatus endophyticus]